MNAIKARIHNGRIETDEPIDLPEGTELLVSISSRGGQDDDDWDNSPEGIASWLKWYDSLQPLIFTPDERAALEANRQARKAWELANFDEHAKKLQRMWE